VGGGGSLLGAVADVRVLNDHSVCSVWGVLALHKKGAKMRGGGWRGVCTAKQYHHRTTAEHDPLHHASPKSKDTHFFCVSSLSKQRGVQQRVWTDPEPVSTAPCRRTYFTQWWDEILLGLLKRHIHITLGMKKTLNAEHNSRYISVVLFPSVNSLIGTPHFRLALCNYPFQYSHVTPQLCCLKLDLLFHSIFRVPF